MPGFIHNKLDIKLLILYVAAHLAAPIELTTLRDLCLCDSGINYFTFTENLDELVSAGHIMQQDDTYIATEKGKIVCANGESSLALTIRAKCDRQLRVLNESLKRKKQIRAEVHPSQNCAEVSLFMDDDTGHVFTLKMMVPSVEEGKKIADSYLDQPSRMFNRILAAVLPDEMPAK